MIAGRCRYPSTAVLHELPLDLEPKNFDAATVDLDGTLVDTLGDFVAAVNAMLADLHTPGEVRTSA
jgi:hypothetical protein